MIIPVMLRSPKTASSKKKAPRNRLRLIVIAVPLLSALQISYFKFFCSFREKYVAYAVTSQTESLTPIDTAAKNQVSKENSSRRGSEHFGFVREYRQTLSRSASPAKNTSKALPSSLLAAVSRQTCEKLGSNANLWLDQNFSDWQNKYSPVKDLVKVFVYDYLAPEFHQDLEDWILALHRNNTPPSNNFHADTAIINLFKTFPGRTYDPDEADIFVVPYPHAADCMKTTPWTLGCEQVTERIQLLLSNLTFFNQTTKHRHLFVLSMDSGLSHWKLKDMPLFLTNGPRKPFFGKGAIVIPYLNDNPSNQPSCLAQRSMEWWTRPRKYAFTYVAGMKLNQRMRGIGRESRILRRHFKDSMQGMASVGGMPYILINLAEGHKHPTTSKAIDEYYRESVFCPILPGDGPQQKRFFDAVLGGCLPLVLSWELESQPGKKSWWLWDDGSGGVPVEASYPFYQGNHQIDYESFVVQVPGNRNQTSNVTMIKSTMESMLQNHSEIRRRQQNLQKYAPFMTYGMGQDAHVREDAFSHILKSLKHYVDRDA